MQRSRAGTPAVVEPRALAFRRLAFRRLAHRPLVVLAVSLLAGCTSPAATPQLTDAAATPTPVPGVTASAPTQPTDAPIATLRPDQVDTAWGPIWEVVPVDFPVLAGAQPAEADEVVSAAYTIPTSSFPDARAVADEYGRRFAVAYGGGVNGPLEDGSYETWASNGYGCDIRVISLPRGPEETYVTVLYGALCPFDWPG